MSGIKRNINIVALKKAFAGRKENSGIRNEDLAIPTLIENDSENSLLPIDSGASLKERTLANVQNLETIRKNLEQLKRKRKARKSYNMAVQESAQGHPSPIEKMLAGNTELTVRGKFLVNDRETPLVFTKETRILFREYPKRNVGFIRDHAEIYRRSSENHSRTIRVYTPQEIEELGLPFLSETKRQLWKPKNTSPAREYRLTYEYENEERALKMQETREETARRKEEEKREARERYINDLMNSLIYYRLEWWHVENGVIQTDFKETHQKLLVKKMQRISAKVGYALSDAEAQEFIQEGRSTDPLYGFTEESRLEFSHHIKKMSFEQTKDFVLEKYVEWKEKLTDGAEKEYRRARVMFRMYACLYFNRPDPYIGYSEK